MGILGAESVVQSPRDGITQVNFHESLGAHGGNRGRSDVQRSMLAYTEKARLLMSTSLPEGLNNGSRHIQQRAYFNPVTWCQSGNAGPLPGYALDYSFPHFKEREDLMGMDKNERLKKSAVKLFVGKENVQKADKTAEQKEKATKPIARSRKSKSRRSVSVASFQTEKSKARTSLVTVNDDKVSHFSFAPNMETLGASSTGLGPYHLALDSIDGTAGEESDISGPIFVSGSQGHYENRSAKMQRGAYSIGRLFPPRSTGLKLPNLDSDHIRKLSQSNPRRSPLYLLVGKSESVPNINDVGRDTNYIRHPESDKQKPRQEGGGNNEYDNDSKTYITAGAHSETLNVHCSEEMKIVGEAHSQEAPKQLKTENPRLENNQTGCVIPGGNEKEAVNQEDIGTAQSSQPEGNSIVENSDELKQGPSLGHSKSKKEKRKIVVRPSVVNLIPNTED